MTDLAGNIFWTYAAPGPATNSVQGVKLLPNGDFLMAIGPNSVRRAEQIPPGTISEIREMNLAGDTVREIEIDDLNRFSQLLPALNAKLHCRACIMMWSHCPMVIGWCSPTRPCSFPQAQHLLLTIFHPPTCWAM